MGDYRRDRVEMLIKEGMDKNRKEGGQGLLTVEDMKRIQSDLVSLQAKRFMEILQPIIQQSSELSAQPLAQLLAKWDFTYYRNSSAATLFEEFYRELKKEVLAKSFVPSSSAKNITNNWEKVDSRVLGVGFHYFDDLVFAYDPKDNELFWKNESREKLFERVLKKTIGTRKEIPTWGESRTLS